MDLQAGYPYSLVKYGLPNDYPKLDRDLRTTVAVIGGGISGALTAHALVQAGIACVVLDARTVGLGSTVASTSLLQYEIDVPLSKLIPQIGRSRAERAYRLCADAIAALAGISKRLPGVPFDRRPSLYLASYQKHLSLIIAEHKARRAMGLDVVLWDADTVKHTIGLDAPGGIYSRTGAQTDAYLLTHGLHRYNIKKGAQVYDRTLVTHIRHHKKGAVLTTATGHTVHTRKIIVATGYESLQYIREKIVDLRSTYAIAGEHGETATPWYENCLIWETKDPYLYLRTTPDKRIVAGGRDEQFYSPARRDKLLKRKTRQLEQDVRRLFPHLPFHAEFSWTGTFGSTQDGLPYIGEYPRMPHTFFALGFGGNGITFSQVAADIVCRLVQGRKHPDAALFSFSRYKG
ncbi:NAD(P)/FAD-dependent oxidoreductase [Chitinophaga alhagiae]|uniref:NAD(P)/FAD-dependent oxidoreductase n=1 Tax=Chitinophaga alhagiae TaxID=2203219 RepID=UPI000E5B3B95|nr:FAD-dependent oxidoreductase [Chitinophaga alhagiae]